MTVELELVDDIAVLTLARPERHNAFDHVMKDALAVRIAELERREARAVVVIGRGRSFSSGADLAMLSTFVGDDARRFMFETTMSFRRLARLPMPVIAAVAGYCLGGGFELALHCDAIVAADDAVFGFPEAALGLVTTSGSVARLVDAIGTLRAKQVLVLGRRIAAGEAIGLTHDVVPRAELHDTAMRIARAAATAPRASIVATKGLVAAATEARAASSFVAELEAFSRLASKPV